MPRAVAVSLQKGGVGKTTIAINVADRLSNRGHEVLLVDLDPQGHATEGVGLYEAYSEKEHVGNVLVQENPQDSVGGLIKRGPGFDVLPSNRDLDEVEDPLKNAKFGILRFKRRIIDPLLGGEYEYIVIDTPPSLGILSDSALVGSQNVIIPLETRESSVRGLEQMIEKQIRPIRKEIDLKILAIVPNRLSGDNEDKRVIDQLEQNFLEYLPLFARSDIPSPGPGIRKRVAMSRAWRKGEPLSQYDPDNDMIPRFDELAEIVERGGVQNGGR